MALNAHKRFRQGQILKLVSSEPISSQDELRKRLSHVKVRVTQATLSRDMSELKLVKTTAGYKPLSNGEEAVAPLPPLGRALREFLVDLRPAYNMLVLKTPPSGAQPLAAALDAEEVQRSGGHARRGRHRIGDHALGQGRASPSRNAWRICSDERPDTGRGSRGDGAMQASELAQLLLQAPENPKNQPSICGRVPRT